MTTEPGSDGGVPRRKFDDVTSLFGPISSGAGASRFPPHRPAFIPIPPTYTAPVKPVEPVPPQEVAVPDHQMSDDPETVAEITVVAPVARQRPTEIPWPDAFEPRPNYRKPEGNRWSWFLLIPAGLVAAAAITLIDARRVRMWVDTTLLNRVPVAGIMDSPLLPPPFRAAPIGNMPAGTAAPPEEDIPFPAIPTSPLPVPPGAEVSPPPAETAATAVTTATSIHVTIQFRRNVPGADGEARRIAALLQSYGGSIELHPNAATVRAATINYYDPADKDAAAALAGVLVNEAASWIVRPGPTKNPPGTLEVWLP